MGLDPLCIETRSDSRPTALDAGVAFATLGNLIGLLDGRVPDSTPNIQADGITRHGEGGAREFSSSSLSNVAIIRKKDRLIWRTPRLRQVRVYLSRSSLILTFIT